MITFYKIKRPLVMGVINLTDNSFYKESRCNSEEEIVERYEKMLKDGADIIDLGACSTKPGSTAPSEEEEWERLKPALKIVLRKFPESEISIDTFRASIVLRAFDFVGDFIINDISAGEDDPAMIEIAAKLKLPYIAMHKRGKPHEMQQLCKYDNVTLEIKEYFKKFIKRAEAAGVEEIVIDPGFGFAKNIDQNYQLLSELDQLKIERSSGDGEYPILVGLSRKSMIYKLLDKEPQSVLHATAALNMAALIKGASIIRVHDVKEAAEVVKMFNKF